ncbi:MAG: helix-turn-helix transcriptional regulator [Candidatus Gastranaerophilales bacterium]|nr:helix-turn-helix transcriptional regulator [Candidatus Gastranaerophilales bacterium]
MTNETTKLIKLGKNISYFRKLKNLSQNALAEKLQISREHLAKLETAKRRISLKLLFELADILEVEEKELLDFK